ncbi:MAG: hypothetical protein AAF098_18150 [Pseudomonadota bacterium]
MSAKFARRMLSLLIVLLAAAQAVAEDRTLQQIWLLDGFSAPEGAALGPNGELFISNVAGGGSEKDGEGWISLLSLAGKLIELRWLEGLDAPKGMVVKEGTLFVTDIDRVRRYRIETKEQLPPINVPDAKFLNDAAVYQGSVLVSDSRTGRIHKLIGGRSEVFLDDAEVLAGVNGLLANGEGLLISTMNRGELLRYDDKQGLRKIAGGMENADGIGITKGGYLVSSWPGEIYFVTPKGKVRSLLNTRDEEILQNDLSVFGEVIVVPNWDPDTVTAWRFE